MDNGTPSLAPELATPPASPDVSDTDLDNLDLTGLQPGNDDEGEAPEFDQFEYEGKQYQVPRALKSKLDQLQHMDTDYTRKSQTNSARAKELDERAQRLDEQAKATEEELDTRAQLRTVKSQLDAYGKLTDEQWAQMRQTDYGKWTEHRFHLQALKDAERELTGKISEHDTKRSQAAQSDLTKRIEETQEHARKIKGWSPEMDKHVIEYAQSKGLSDADIAKYMSPIFYDFARLARIGEEVLKRQSAPKPQAEPPAPLERVAAKSTPASTKPSDKDDIDSWMKKYHSRQAKRRAG